MNIPTAKEMRATWAEKKAGKVAQLKGDIEKWIENEVLPQMLISEGVSVVIQVPYYAYGNLDKFLEICKEIFPDDYTLSISRKYNTLVVKW